MFKRVSLVFAAAAICFAATAKGRVETCKMHSDILGADKEYVVYLPEGYDDAEELPVLYLLHGLGGNCYTWTKKYDLANIADFRISSGFSLPMIIVMPDARGVLENNRGENVGYVNREGWMYEDYFFQELIPEVEKRFKAGKGAANRAVAGLSMGGAGTVIYGMHHPECFSSACPMAARVEGTPDHAPGTGGDSEPFYAYSRDNNMVEYLKAQTPDRQKEIGAVRWYIDCGASDSLLPMDMHLYELMLSLGFRNANLRVREGGHKADYWRTSLPEVMTFVSIGFTK